MNYNTSRDECIMLELLLKKLDGDVLEKTLVDIEIHIDRQKAKINSDIKQLENEIKDKKFDLECYDWLASEIQKMKVRC